ncbi:sugar-binding transcriptional regulator [Salinibacillus xinjiangensis]|uniref:Winged helix-turn-helix transcriptional regulator n=1 Tax=Salinibacillus xinjiangensis TaxID=1229268 RepID=A0A6G1X7C7_9BACI|nr:sugar-binding transcriptional regulator [Salinibacillus xinjiangensis]MRG86780.1 winged helix-turn-helix transcriptional regulator [Salinibacillus xinjiangensis]
MNWEEERLLYRIAKLYYDEDYTQAEISKELGIYRTTIGRMLKKARDKGIVKIHVQSNANELFEVEEKIMRHFGMKEVMIVPSFSEQSTQNLSATIAKASNQLLNRILRDEDIVGLAWGKTLGDMVHQIGELKPKNTLCVPLVGGPGGMNTDYHVNAITMRMANALQGKSHFINAAAVYNSKETTQEILESSFMQEIIQLWDELTVAIVGIGAQISSSNMVWSGFLGDNEQNELKKHQAIGDICSRFYTIDGEVVNSSVSERTIGVELEKLKTLRYCIGVANSKEKAESIIGAMRGRFINTLVTNEETALEINRMIEKN